MPAAGPAISVLSPQSSALAYAELHAHTNFSLLDGASDPEDMVRQAAALGLRALAITDHDSVAGIVRFAAEAQRLHLPAIVGAEVTVGSDTRHHLVLLAQNVAGYQHLCALLTCAYRL